jgi:transcriptional regulator CtsR
MRLTDIIAEYILQMLELADDGEAELRRNELAEELGCVPSQINYVITSRFTPEQGYIVESKRGGGGYIRIRRVKLERGVSPLMHIVNAVGDDISPVTAQAIIENLEAQELIYENAAKVMLSALSDQAYRYIPMETRDRLRASLLKQMLAALIT